MPIVLGSFAILVMTKALGGSFHFLFDGLGAPSLHGPVLAAAFGSLMIAFFLRYPATETRPGPASALGGAQALRIALTFAVMLLVADFLWIRGMYVQGMDIKRCDDLFHVMAGLQKVVEGQTPYQPLTMPNGVVVPHYSLPGLWLTYLPLYWLHIDIRFINVLAQSVFYLLLLDAFLKNGFGLAKPPRWRVPLFFALVALTMFSKQWMKLIVDMHTGPYDLYYAVFLWAVLRRNVVLLCFATPLLLLCREPAFLLVLPWAIHLFRFQRAIFRPVFLSTAGIMAVLLVPILLTTPGFLFVALHHFAVTMNQATEQMMLTHFGLLPVLVHFHLKWLQIPLQVGALLLTAWLATRQQKNEGYALALGGVAYTIFMLFVSISYGYVFVEPMMLLYFLLVSRWSLAVEWPAPGWARAKRTLAAGMDAARV